jgi:(1->4)-alpha-D-glucan 1-alpha-D-glucosylmutase
VQLQGDGAVDLLGHPLLATAAQHRWEPTLTTEDPAFAVDSQQPRIDLVENGVIIHFHRPGAVILKEIAVPAVAGSAAPILESPFADEEAFRRYLSEHRRIPLATYRLQLQPAFTFRDAASIIPYLAELGISDVYCSSYLKAAPGSTHGYDICDYGKLNPELGSDADYQALLDELSAHGMGHVLDFVPNHMAIEPVQNAWWHDMLEHGPASPFARFFDVDWEPEKPELKDRVLLPFLGDQYGAVLERGELKLVLEDGRLSVVSGGDQRRPIDPAQYPAVLGLHSESLKDKLAPTDPQHQEFLSIVTALEHLPAVTETAPERSAERLRESRLACKRLAELLAASAVIRDHVAQNLRTINGEPGKPESFNALHNLLERQAYRLAYWKTAGHEINYRRFFDINQLAGLRMEEPAVFTATHALVLRLIGAGKITGLRLDHIDGLFDPAGYLEMLQAAIFEERAAAFLGTIGERGEDWRKKVHAWRQHERHTDPAGCAVRPLFAVVEKILSTGEDLLSGWPIHGSTGYDFLNDVNRLFIDAQNAPALKRVYARFAGRSAPLAELVYACKRTISGTSLASELNVLGQMLNRISEADRRTRDFTLFSLRQTLREIVVCFSVYRTYVDENGATPTDAQLIDLAIRRARARNPAMESSIFDFIRAALVPDRTQLTADQFRARLHFAMKFQQYSGPLQAKGLEDTAYYQYNVLLSLNEVGGDPQRFGGALTQFHEANLRRLGNSPHGMLTTATHDTKRGEDARARLNVLSELPDLWRRSVSRWARLNDRHRTTIDGVPAPDRNDEYLFYQALLGAWPAEPLGTAHAAAPADFVDRMRQFMQKAVKEAKEHTSWISPNDAYDRAVADFVAKSLTVTHGRRFLAEFLPLQQRVARLGLINSLAQLVLKIVSPGVPDFFQGTELWDWSLVDPDNRRPVDFAQRRRMLEELAPLMSDAALRTPALVDMLENEPDGRIKLWVTALGLRLRQQFASVFQRGEYVPVEADGEHAEHVVAIGRRFEGARIIAVVPRLLGQIIQDPRNLPVGPGFWKATCLKLPQAFHGGTYENGLTLERLPVDDTRRLPLGNILQSCPVAILYASG